MQKFHHLRALALLGALIIYFLLWPIYCCAAKPTWSPLHQADTDERMPSNVNNGIQSNLTLLNQTYLGLMAASVISDNTGINDKIADFLNTPNDNNSSATIVDKGTTVHNGETNKNMYKVIDNSRQESVTGETESFSLESESTTTSIYEMFGLRKSKRKLGSNNQILSRTDRSVHLNSSNSKNNSVSGAKRVKNNKAKLSTLERNERSANLSHITGSARKIQLYIKNRFLQLLPDGTVNGTTDDLSDYSEYKFFFFRISVQASLAFFGTCKTSCMSCAGKFFERVLQAKSDERMRKMFLLCEIILKKTIYA